MSDDERLKKLLREALEPKARGGPAQDLWPQIEARGSARARWSWVDLGLAAAATAILLMRPGWLWLLAYHL